MINHLGVALDTLEPRREAQIQPREPVGPAVFPPNFNPRAIPAEASSNGSGEIGNFRGFSSPCDATEEVTLVCVNEPLYWEEAKAILESLLMIHCSTAIPRKRAR